VANLHFLHRHETAAIPANGGQEPVG